MVTIGTDAMARARSTPSSTTDISSGWVWASGKVQMTRRRSITAHYANGECRRQIEKSPLAQIEMSLSTVLVGEFWADDGDYDEPDGDRPDGRVAGSGGEQDQGDGSRDADEPWSASGVPAGQGVRQAWPAGAGVPEARPAEQIVS